MQSIYASMDDAALDAAIADLEAEVESIRARQLKLDMSRGKPSPEQLDLSMPLLDAVNGSSDCHEGAVDCRNYGVLEGLAPMRELMGQVLGVPASQVFVGGTSSLTLEFDAMEHGLLYGVMGCEPQLLQMQRGPLKWICLTPGYDRHFGIAAQFGFELVSVPLGADGPDMDAVRALVADPAVKGMWCVPKYSNPTGITYSDEVVAAIAALEPAAPDFRVYWDNAYCEHHLDADPANQDQLANIFELCDAAGHPDMVYAFCSTSKVTFPGAGVSALATSPANLADLLAMYKHAMIGHDKLNQLRHLRFFGDLDGLRAHMVRQAEILRPRFELVERKLTEGLGGMGIATWTHPRGGYFVSFDGPAGSAKAIVAMARDLGVVLTGAGATYPYGDDPADSNIRIAPTLPGLPELAGALDVLVTCTKLIAARLERDGRTR